MQEARKLLVAPAFLEVLRFGRLTASNLLDVVEEREESLRRPDLTAVLQGRVQVFLLMDNLVLLRLSGGCLGFLGSRLLASAELEHRSEALLHSLILGLLHLL